MNPPISRRAVALLGAVTTALAAFAVSPATALAQTPKPNQNTSPVYAAADKLARQLALSMRDRTTNHRVVSTVTTGPAPLANLGLDSAFTNEVRDR